MRFDVLMFVCDAHWRSRCTGAPRTAVHVLSERSERSLPVAKERLSKQQLEADARKPRRPRKYGWREPASIFDAAPTKRPIDRVSTESFEQYARRQK
jgi:hypothetical protein